MRHRFPTLRKRQRCSRCGLMARIEGRPPRVTYYFASRSDRPLERMPPCR